MTTTFQKRQKEMKRIEKRKMKEEKRAQRKLDKPAATEIRYDPASDPTIDWNHSSEISSKECLRLNSAAAPPADLLAHSQAVEAALCERPRPNEIAIHHGFCIIFFQQS